MAQHDYIISNATFPSIRTDINSVLSAINTSNSGTSRPSSAVAGTIWLDTSGVATAQLLKLYDGADDILLGTINFTANTIDWADSVSEVSLTGTETLTNKTLTSPKINEDVALTSTATELNKLDALSRGSILYGNASAVTSILTKGTAAQVLTSDGTDISWGDVSAGTSWQSIITASTLTAVAGNGYPINTTSNACTVTLPASASVGDSIQIVDYAGTFATNYITLTSSLNIEGSGGDKYLTTNREGVTVTYVDVTQGWVATSGVNSGIQALDNLVDFLVVAGGGGGGCHTGGAGVGGGGGAGGYRNSYLSETSGGGGSSEESLYFNSGTVYTITVGSGGAGASSGTQFGTDGVNSSISGTGLTTITSIGGGGGGGYENGAGRTGGSGGGGGQSSGAGGSGTANQGYAGGSSGGSSGGGGGGANAVGANTGASDAGGAGGNGLASSITGSSVTRTGGGGGGSYNTGTVASGGTGGGGAGATNPASAVNAVAGTVNTGSGGGGGIDARAGASGGSGVVILRMSTADYSGTTSGSPTVSTDGTDTILIYNASGSYTA